MLTPAPPIREIGPDEFGRVWPLFHEVVVRGDSYPYPSDLSMADACAMWTSPPARCFVAEDDDRVLGCYRIAPNHMGRGNHVANGSYMVAADARGRGVGAALCEHSLDEARRSGFSAMQFNLVVSTNTAAVRLWTRCGFAIVGTLPDAFHHAELGRVDAYVMHRAL